jgi:hypothetical protein
LLDWQIGRLCTLQQSGDLVGGERIKVRYRDAITRKASGFHPIAELADRRNLGGKAQLSEPLP